MPPQEKGRVLSKISKSDTPSAKHDINSLLTLSLHESKSKPTVKRELNANENFQMSTRVFNSFLESFKCGEASTRVHEISSVGTGKLLSTVMKMRTLTSSIRVAESSRELHSVL